MQSFVTTNSSNTDASSAVWTFYITSGWTCEAPWCNIEGLWPRRQRFSVSQASLQEVELFEFTGQVVVTFPGINSSAVWSTERPEGVIGVPAGSIITKQFKGLRQWRSLCLSAAAAWSEMFSSGFTCEFNKQGGGKIANELGGRYHERCQRNKLMFSLIRRSSSCSEGLGTD